MPVAEKTQILVTIWQTLLYDEAMKKKIFDELGG